MTIEQTVEIPPKAKEIIEQHIVEVPVEVLCEVIYVLTGYYKIDRQKLILAATGKV
jgi:hypothetical protein